MKIRLDRLILTPVQAYILEKICFCRSVMAVFAVHSIHFDQNMDLKHQICTGIDVSSQIFRFIQASYTRSKTK